MASASASAWVIRLVRTGARVIFFRMVILGKRLKCWNTMPIWQRMALISTLGSVISVPSKVMMPSVGVSSRFRQRRKVDLPEPEGPMTTTFSPGSMCWSMWSSTRLLPKDLHSPLTSITLTQPPFQLALEPGEDQYQHQIDTGRAHQGEHLLIVPVGNGPGEVQDLLAADDADEGCILEQNDKFIAQGRQNGLER